MTEQTTVPAPAKRLPFSDQLPLETQFNELKSLYFKIQGANDANLREIERLSKQLDAHKRDRYSGHNTAEAANGLAAQWEKEAIELRKRVAELEAEKAADPLPMKIMKLNCENAALRARESDATKALSLFRELQRLAESSE